MKQPTDGIKLNRGTKIEYSLRGKTGNGSTMANSRETSFEGKKAEICYAAAEIFAEKGYEKTTLEDISAELNMTKSGLYHYFDGKEDILFHCLIKAHTMANEALSKIVGRKGLRPDEKLRLAIREHVKVLSSPFVYSTLRQQELLLPKGLRDEIRVERSKFQQMFVSIVQEGIDQGHFRVGNLKLVSFAMLGSVNWVARWYSPKGPFTPEEISEAFCELIFSGIRA
jgi:AcrR family transcriptional regulator